MFRVRRRVMPPPVDIGIAAALFGVAVVEVVAASTSVAMPLLITSAVVVTLPLAWRRVTPVPVLLVILGGAALVPADLDLPIFVFVGMLLAVYAVGSATSSAPAAIAGLVVVLGFFAVGWAVDRATHGDAAPGDLVFIAFVYGGTWATAQTLRRRRLRTEALENRAQQLEASREEQARLAVEVERSRIARELHDIVAHSVSVMVVQAGGAEQLVESDPSRVRDALVSIQETGRQAVVELRRLLGILRESNDGLALSPQPGLSSLDALVAQAEAAGLSVRLEVEGNRVAIAPGIDLSAYRIAQEALTNVRKHSTSRSAWLTVRYRPDAVEVEVVDPGPPRVTPPIDGECDQRGHGLVGMRERTMLYGGTLEAGPADGGYRVSARLPLVVG